jgi:hypothetical protein
VPGSQTGIREVPGRRPIAPWRDRQAEGKWHNIATMEANRRTFMKAGLAAAILPQASGVTSSVPRKGRIRQSVSRWCYDQIPLDQLCVAAAQMGLNGVDLLEVAEFDIPRRYGLICTMGYAGGGTISDALNRTEHNAPLKRHSARTSRLLQRWACRASSPFLGPALACRMKMALAIQSWG